MQANEAVVGAKVQSLDGNEYTIASVREANAPEGFTEVSLSTKSGVTVKGDTRQLVLLELPNDTEEQIEERKRAREEETRKKQEDLKKRAEKANLDKEQSDKLTADAGTTHQRMMRAASTGDQKAVNRMLAGNEETYTGGIIHPAYAGVPAHDALRRDGVVYPTDNSPGDSPEREPAAPSGNPNDVDALGDDDSGRKTIAGTPSQRLSKTPVPGTVSRDDRGPMGSSSTQSDDAALLERQKNEGTSGTSNEAMKNLLERMKTGKEEEKRGNMTEEEKREEKKKEAEQKDARAAKNELQIAADTGRVLTEEQRKALEERASKLKE